MTRDTNAPTEDEEAMLERYRQMDPGEKLLLVFQMFQEGVDRDRDEIRSKYRARYGREISERELWLRMASRHVPRESLIRDFGWDPEAPENSEPRT
ncbi:MAG: hypothetical protein DMF53_10640 [Acidobacteria bacterium]|jgi:hypothetical protein|nr:MAG: hypothetical protein DMF53_10640 [Acidobacteriota bacterium]